MIISLDENLMNDFREFVISYLEKHRSESSAIAAKTIINRFICFKSNCSISGLKRSHFLQDHHISKQRLTLVLFSMANEGLIIREKSTHKVKYSIGEVNHAVVR